MYNGNIEYFCLTKGDITYMNKFVFSDFICPICKFPLNFDSENEHAQMMCPNCSNKVEPINAALAQRRDNASFPDIRNAPALFAFVDTYFESSIGDDFFTSCDSFTVKTVDDTVANTLLYTANEPLAWRAEFERLLLPMEKKLAYLEGLPEKIAKEHLDDKLGEQMYFFDIYESTLKELGPHIERIRPKLDFALERAEKFGMEKDCIKALKDRLCALEARVCELSKEENLPKDPVLLDAVKEARQKRDARINEALIAMGVSAEDTYVSAVGLVKKKKNAQALDMFRQLGSYKDSAEQISELNCYKKFDDIRSIAGKLYLCQKKQAISAKNKSHQTALYDLIPLDEQNPELVPLDTPMHKIIATYADKIYHLNKDKQLTCLDLQDSINRAVLLDGKSYLFDEHTKFYSFDGLCKLAVAAKEQVIIEKGRHKGKLRATDTDLLLIDLSSEEMTLCDFGIDDIVCICDSYIFYRKENNAIPGESGKQLIGYNVVTGKRVTMPQNVYKVHAVVDEYVIFSYQKSSPYNLSLRALSCGVTSFERVLEDNILDFSGVIDQKIYYSVGSYDMRVLCRIDPVTLERREIQRGIKAKSGSEILLVREGWMYFKKGDDKNTVLARCRPDGSDYSVVCSSFERFACSMPFIRGYVYYFDTNGSLCRVLISGRAHKVISDNIVKDMGILAFYDGKICFARHEYAGKCAVVKQSFTKKATSSIVQTDKYSLSLYTCNLDGSQLCKLCFDFDYVWQLSRSSLLIKRVQIDRFIEKNKRSVIEYAKTYYEILDLCDPSKPKLLASFENADASKGLPKGIIHVTLKDEAKDKKLPPISSK